MNCETLSSKKDTDEKQFEGETCGVDWNQKINTCVNKLNPSGIRSFFDIVAERSDCISLGVGEPDFISPGPILESAISSIRKGFTHYTANQGLLSLRKKIAHYLSSEYGLTYDPENEILITVGVSQGLDLALRSIVEPNDKVIFPTPSYVSYNPLIKISGGVPDEISLNFSKKFHLLAKDIAERLGPKTKGVILNYPSNPTGASLDREMLKLISDLVIRHNLLVISDEIYGELTYDHNHIPIASLPGMKERTLLLGGFSKVFAMTGWRIGYACGPEKWIYAMLKIHQYAMLCAPTVSQIAAEAALDTSIPHRDQMIELYRQRREEIVSSFNEMGLKCHKPEGAFYIFPEIKSTSLSSIDFAKKLLEQQSVAVVPGTAFGEGGEGFIRCSYATSMSDIKESTKRIKQFINSI